MTPRSWLEDPWPPLLEGWPKLWTTLQVKAGLVPFIAKLREKGIPPDASALSRGPFDTKSQVCPFPSVDFISVLARLKLRDAPKPRAAMQMTIPIAFVKTWCQGRILITAGQLNDRELWTMGLMGP